MTSKKQHLLIDLEGFVQGLGFRPFVYRLAKLHQQYGWVINTSQGLSISIEGACFQQQSFLHDLQNRLPAFAEIRSLSVTQQSLENYDRFLIKTSISDGQNSTFVLPDISTCAECIADIFNPESRFYQYPFTSCCYCGPRYSILQQQPYDRVRTSMAAFCACEECLADYALAENRRFHSQTIACKHCGPQLSFLDNQGGKIESGDQALIQAINYLKQGKIIAIKGIGGFQLLLDATNKKAVETLRLRKFRPEKSFALLVKDLAAAKILCQISQAEEVSLTSAASPIMLLKSLNTGQVVDAVAPNNHLLGLMLPASPLHHLLARGVNRPLVASSGNKKGEPICVTDEQAISKLSNIADFFLTHNRDILRPLDDSIIRVINHKAALLRRARGYTPLPITISQSLPDQLAVGGQMKNTVAISQGHQLIVSQHIGELDTLNSQIQFQQSITDLQRFYSVLPETIMHDFHPDYHSTVYAEQQTIDKQPIQHHHAHILSCMAEHDIQTPVLGFAWDGTGLGSDNTLWGGECLLLDGQSFQRYAYFRPFSLIGGDKAASEPRRSALALVYELAGNDVFENEQLAFLSTFTGPQRQMLKQCLNKQLNTPLTSSVGRLFDAVSSLLDLCHVNCFEGQAAMLLEQAASLVETDASYPYDLVAAESLIIDWQAMIIEILADIPKLTVNLIAAKFHNTLADMMLNIANQAQQQNVVISGGCFQNAYLTERCVTKLETAGFTVYSHEKIPPNDAGLALGQLYYSALTG